MKRRLLRPAGIAVCVQGTGVQGTFPEAPRHTAGPPLHRRPSPRLAGILSAPPLGASRGAQAHWLLGVLNGFPAPSVPGPFRGITLSDSRDPFALPRGPERGPAFGAAGREPACPLRRARAEAVRLRAGPQGALHGGAAGGGGRRTPGRGECRVEAGRWVGFGGSIVVSRSPFSAPHPAQGGQILRVSTALSCLLGLPLRVQRIRAGRSTPGLR